MSKAVNIILLLSHTCKKIFDWHCPYVNCWTCAFNIFILSTTPTKVRFLFEPFNNAEIFSHS